MELIVDNFAGGGGASTGIEMATGRSVDIAINHAPDAIAMHRANHPHTRHYCEDVWQVDPVEACAGNPVGLAWFSPDCTHFSRAKGGKPVDKNIRGLAWVTIRWALKVRPRIIMLENVPEIRTWGPLGADNKPLAENTLRRIARGIEKFVINNPEPFIVTVNHSGEGFRGQKADEPLGTITAKNGYGVVTPTIMCNNTGNAGAAVDTPLPTVTTGNRNYMVAPSLIQYHSETASDEVRGQELNEPLMTVDTSPRYALSVAHIMKNYGGNYQGAGSGADKPLDTVTAHDHNSLITAHILTMRNNMDGQPADEPLATITAGGSHHAEVQAFLVKYFSNGTPKPVNSPLDTVTTKDRFALVTIHGEEYIITDIKMRMLQPRELFNAQGFPADYIIDHDDSGKPYPKSKQTARCGNAVTPPVPAALVRANLPEMCGGGI